MSDTSDLFAPCDEWGDDMCLACNCPTEFCRCEIDEEESSDA